MLQYSSATSSRCDCCTSPVHGVVFPPSSFRSLHVARQTSRGKSALCGRLQALIARSLSDDAASVDCMLLSSGMHIPGDTQSAADSVAIVTAASDLSIAGTGNDRRFAIFYLYVTGQFLAEATLVGALRSMLEQFRGESTEVAENSFIRLASHFILLAIRCFGRSELGALSALKTTVAALNAWLALTSRSDGPPLRTEIVESLEELLFLNLSNELSSLALSEHGSELLVRRCLNTMLAGTRETSRRFQGCLLTSMILSDPVKFSSTFLRALVEDAPTTSYRLIFDSGLLDAAMNAVLSCHAFVADNLDDVMSLFLFLIARATAVTDILLGDHRSLDGLVSVLLTLARNATFLPIANFTAVTELLKRLLELRQGTSIRLLDYESNPLKEKILELAFHVCLKNYQDGTNRVAALSTDLLQYLCGALPQCLKAYFTGKNPSDHTYTSNPLRLITWLRALLHGGVDYDLFFPETSLVTSLIRTCLRYGIGKISERQANTRLSCLKVVRSLVMALTDKSSTLPSPASPLALTTTLQVFNMVTSHSKFDALMKSAGEQDLKLEVVQILYSSLLATSEIAFDLDFWNCLLACFNAGVSEIDLAIRSLLRLYGSITTIRKSTFSTQIYSVSSNADPIPQDSHYLLLDQLRWGKASYCQGHSKNNWEWLVEAIELSRIYATIENFPVHDLLAPPPLLEDHWRAQSDVSLPGQKNDQRYSPGFLLPMVLGALEDEADSMDSRLNASRAHGAVPDSGNGKGTLIAQRLCEKGALALTLACFGSKCPSLRKLSASIIGLLAEATDCPDAHQSTSWRERPQLAMILFAVQRALVLRYSDEIYQNEKPPTFEVPQLPGFSAIFLARASLTLGHPSDHLYQAINRSFLRTEVDGGGFQDLTRLPAFMSLFCSSSNVADQLIAERKFALELVKDGFTDEDSYKLLMACHCPELLLTSIESTRARSSIVSGDELPLLFNTLSALVISGGERSASHLINRLGLLSWLRALLIGNPELIKFSSRGAVLRLLTEVAERAAPLIPVDEFALSTAGVAQAALSFALECVDGSSGFKNRSVGHKLSDSIITYVCQLLSTFSRTVAANDVGNQLEHSHLRHCHLDGIHLESAIQFISLLHSHQDHGSALFAICVLPVRCRLCDSSPAIAFCELILASSAATRDCDPKLILAVLLRVTFLSEFLGTSLVVRKPMLQILLSWRSECARGRRQREAWFACLAALTNGVAYDEENRNDSVTDGSDESDLVCWVLRNLQLATITF